MGIDMSESEAFDHCQDAVSELDKVISEFRESPHEKCKKRAILIAYWIKTYAKYLRSEDSFNPEALYKLKRGSIVQVEFGYRLGSELGGIHYAVVIDAYNTLKGNTVTVIPLGSLKPTSKENRYSLHLENGVYELVYNKIDSLLKSIETTLQETEPVLKSIETTLQETEPVDEKINNAKKSLELAKKWISKMHHMKSGTVAHIDQITTISKMRISQPLTKSHPLFGVRIIPDDMDLIDEKIKNLYFPLSKRE